MADWESTDAEFDYDPPEPWQPARPKSPSGLRDAVIAACNIGKFFLKISSLEETNPELFEFLHKRFREIQERAVEIPDETP